MALKRHPGSRAEIETLTTVLCVVNACFAWRQTSAHEEFADLVAEAVEASLVRDLL